MRIFKKTKKANGRRHIYLFGIKIFSYKKTKKKNHPTKIYWGVIDYLGGDFKKYIYENEMPSIEKRLKQGLDKKSCAVIDAKIQDFLNWPNKGYKVQLSTTDIRDFLTDEEISQLAEKDAEYQQVLEKYKMQNNCFFHEVFLEHHGLKNLPDSVKKYMKGKDMLDIGAYVGDSAVALHQYNFRKIYMFEALKSVYSTIEQNMADNNIRPDEYQIVSCMVGSENKEIELDLESHMASINYKGSNKVKMITLDAFDKQNNINVGLMKLDIEGAEMDAFNGAFMMLKKHRPVITSAIYHNPYEFFELKPLLEKHLSNYVFEIRNLSPRVPHRETTLICYPKEALK